MKMIEMFRYLTGILEEKERKQCRIYMVLSFTGPALDLFCYFMIIHIINTVIRTDQVSARIAAFTFLMGTLSLLKIFFDLYRCKLSARFICEGAQKLSLKLYEVLIKEDLEEHNRKSPAQAMMMVQGDAVNCINIITDGITVCSNIFTMTGFSIVLIYVSGWIGVFSCIILVICMLSFFSVYRNTLENYGSKCRTYRIKVNAQTAVTYGVFRELKINDNSDFILHKYRDISGEYARIQSEFSYKNNGIGATLQNAALTVMFIVLGFFLIMGGDLPYILGLLIAYITALIRMLPVAYGILSGINNIEFIKKSYETVRECLIQYKKIKEREKSVQNIRQKELSFEQGLKVEHLTFGYSGKAQVFDDANIDIPAGYSAAVIGVSGAGKTTFLDLILGLLKPQSGSIMYDDYNIVSQTDREGTCRVNLGKIVSYIPQLVYLNGETIRNNVAFFDDEIDDGKVEEALKCAQLWDDVLKFPEGVHTLIGENGIAISGGQRQRIALARALYKDFQLLIMDEATAALDMETEKAVIDSIRQVKGNKTILIVTHHMNLANECDLIYKIENKKIVRVK